VFVSMERREEMFFCVCFKGFEGGGVDEGEGE